MQNNIVDVVDIEKKIGYTFSNKELLVRAFTHTSFCNEHRNMQNYERFEFLGDAALGYVIGLYLYENYPTYDEGKLTKMRAGVVDRKTIADVVDALDIIRYVRAGKGNAQDLSSSVKVKCDVFEAIIGAIIIDNNNEINAAKSFILRFLKGKIGAARVDYKSYLLELCAKNGHKAEFVVKKNEEDVNNIFFIADLYIDGSLSATGEGHNTKSAEQCACKIFFSNK